MNSNRHQLWTRVPLVWLACRYRDCVYVFDFTELFPRRDCLRGIAGWLKRTMNASALEIRRADRPCRSHFFSFSWRGFAALRGASAQRHAESLLQLRCEQAAATLWECGSDRLCECCRLTDMPYPPLHHPPTPAGAPAPAMPLYTSPIHISLYCSPMG